MVPSLQEAAPRSSLSLLAHPPIAALAALLALTANFLFASGHDWQRCAEVVALSVMAIIVLARAGKGDVLPIPKQTGAFLLVFFALGLVSTSTAYSFRHAVNEWSSLLLLLVLVYAIAAELVHDVRRWPVLLKLVGLACALYSLRAVILYAAALASGYQSNFSLLAPGFSNARFLNHTQTALMPLIILLCLKTPRADGWRKVWFLLAAFWWSLLFVTETRATILALTLGCGAVLALRRSHARPFIVMMLWTALAGLVLYGLLYILLPVSIGMQPIAAPFNVVARTAANPISDRSLLWNLAVQLISSHPWLGVGPQHFAHEGATLSAAAHPHNWVLQIATEWGIPALLCLIGAVVLGGRALIRVGTRLAADDVPNQQILVALQVACTAILVDAFFSGVLVMPQSRLAIALVLGMAYAWVSLQGGVSPADKPVRSVTARIASAGLAAVGLCGLLWSVAPDFARHARDEPLTREELAVNPAKHWPRLWEAGFF